MAGRSRGTLIELTGVHYDLPFSIEPQICPVHRPGRRTLKINPFAVVSAAMAGAFKFVLALHPIGSAAQMCTFGVDDKKSLGVPNDPDPMFLLKSSIHPKTEI